MKDQRDTDRRRLVFGNVTIDLDRRILIREGQRQDLSEAYWKALIELVRRRPDVVTKTELQALLQLTEPSLPKAIELIRGALGDTEEPRKFIVTERGQGYRFIAAISVSRRRRLWLAVAIVAGVVVLVAAGILFRTGVIPRPKTKRFYKIARADRADIPLLTDGRYLYFGQWDNGRFSVNRVLATGGEPTPIPTSLPNPELCDISPDGQLLLVRSIAPGGARINPAPLWILRVNGEAVGRVGNVLVVDASWMPDGKRISYSNGPEIFVVAPDGTDERKLTSINGEPKAILWWLRWSNDGRLLRFTVTRTGVLGRSIWEVRARGGSPQALQGMDRFVDACCGLWTADRRHYVFGGTTREGATQIWSMAEQSPPDAANHLSTVLTPFGLTSYRGPLISRDGEKLFMRSTVAEGEIVSYEPTARKWTPLLRDISAAMIATSQDGRKITYITLPDFALWAANADGSGRQQLTGSTLQAAMPRWSPLGDQVAFMGRLPGRAWRVYVVRFPYGAPTEIIPNQGGQQADPDWSPSGQQLVFGQNPAQATASGVPAIFVLNLLSGTVSPIPGSDRLDSPRWSPDGRSVVAVEAGTRRLLIYELSTKKWLPLTGANASNAGYPCWSKDSQFVYFLSSERRADSTTENVVMRIHAKSRALSRFASLADIRQGAFTFGTWIGLDYKDVMLAVRDLTKQEIDAVDWP